MIDEISDAEHIPKSFLAKIFQSLVKGGFVLSHRGAGGGFGLAKPPVDISLLQIFQCVEGAFGLQKCVTDDPACVMDNTACNISRVVVFPTLPVTPMTNASCC